MPTQYLFPLLVKALDFSKGTIICPLSVHVPGLKHQITDKWHFYLTGATENCKTPCYDFCWDYWEEKIAVFHVYHWEGCQKLCLHKEKPWQRMEPTHKRAERRDGKAGPNPDEVVWTLYSIVLEVASALELFSYMWQHTYSALFHVCDCGQFTSISIVILICKMGIWCILHKVLKD